MLIGNSAAEMILFMTSISRRKFAPIMKDRPTVSELSVPMIVLTSCGITRPIHPIEPDIETAVDTRIVAATRKMILYSFMLKPRFVAVFILGKDMVMGCRRSEIFLAGDFHSGGIHAVGGVPCAVCGIEAEIHD